MTWVNIENGENALSIRNKINALGADVDTKVTQSALNSLTATVGTKADLVNGIVNPSQLYPNLDSYIAFCANVNTNAIDAAFGKNNEDKVYKIGEQLAMYAWFKGDSKTTFTFTNLISQHTYANALANGSSDIRASQNLMDLIIASPYAKAAAVNYLPMLGEIPCSASTGSFVATSTAGATLQTVTVPTTGYYRIRFCTYKKHGYYVELYIGGTKVNTYGGTNSGGNYSYDAFITAGTVITLKNDAYATDTVCSPILLCTLKPVVYPTTKSAGNRIVLFNFSRLDTSTDGTSGSCNSITIPYAGTYTIKFGLSGYQVNTALGANFSLRKNGVVVQTIGFGGVTSLRGGYSYNVACAAGDTIDLSYLVGSGAADDFMGTCGLTASITATDGFPA